MDDLLKQHLENRLNYFQINKKQLAEELGLGSATVTRCFKGLAGKVSPATFEIYKRLAVTRDELDLIEKGTLPSNIPSDESSSLSALTFHFNVEPEIAEAFLSAAKKRGVKPEVLFQQMIVENFDV